MKQIIGHLLASEFSASLHGGMQEELQKVLTGENPVPMDLRVEFYNDDTSCSLRIDHTARWSAREELYTKNERGDEYVRTSFKLGLNYPSHGSCDVERIIRRIEFLAKTAQFAKKIQDEFVGAEYTFLNQTAEQIAEAKKFYAHQKQERILNESVKDLAHGLREGKTRSVDIDHDDTESKKYVVHTTSQKSGARKEYEWHVKGKKLFVTRTA